MLSVEINVRYFHLLNSNINKICNTIKNIKFQLKDMHTLRDWKPDTLIVFVIRRQWPMVLHSQERSIKWMNEWNYYIQLKINFESIDNAEQSHIF